PLPYSPQGRSRLNRTILGPRMPKPKATAKGGRKTRLTAELQEIIIDTLRGGHYMTTAADFAGVSVDTIYDWIQPREGRHPTRKPTAQLTAFAEAVKKAQADWLFATLQRIQGKGRDIPPERRTSKRTITDAEGKTLKVIETVEPEEKYASRARQYDLSLI